MYVQSHPDLSEIITSRCGWLDLCGMTTIYRAFYQSLDQAWSLHSIFFSIKVLFHGHWQLTGQQGKGGDHLLFYSTTSTRSQSFRDLFAALPVKWLSHIFSCIACIYQLLVDDFYHLIKLPFDWLMMWCWFLFAYVMIWF